MAERKSITNRLIATVVLAQLLLAAGLVVTSVVYTQRRLKVALDTSLQGQVLSLVALIRDPEDSGKLGLNASMIPKPIDAKHPDAYRIETDNGQILARSANWPADLDPALGQKHPYFEFVHAGVPYRALRLRSAILDNDGDGPYVPPYVTVTYAAPTLDIRYQVRQTAADIAVSSLLMLLVTGMLSLWAVKRGMSPLRELTQKAERVSIHNWNFESPVGVNNTQELYPLGHAMETMLSGLRHSFSQQRDFLGNAAHELKTPVAVLKSTIQSLLQKPRTAEEYRFGLEQSTEDIDRLEMLLHSMLRLARAEQWSSGALRLDLESINLAASCQESVDRLSALSQARNLEVTLTADRSIQLRADPDDLGLVWTNLLENAIRYSPEGGAIAVSLTRNGSNDAVVTVQDYGCGIPADDLPRIFERFHRGDDSRARKTGGFGLGLAISKALVNAYGGSLSATSVVGAGTQMTVHLPLGANLR